MAYAAESMGFSKGEAFVIDWQYRYAGSFTETLAELMVKADEDNLSRLEKAFPEEVRAFRKYRTVPGWWQDVQKGFFIRCEEFDSGKTYKELLEERRGNLVGEGQRELAKEGRVEQ